MYAGLNRGIFGVQNARKVEVESLLQLLEAANPSPRPTDDLDKVPTPGTISVALGCWTAAFC
jgi:hypothetical protein